MPFTDQEVLALVKQHGNPTHAARAVGVPERTFRDRWAKLQRQEAAQQMGAAPPEALQPTERQRFEDRISKLTTDLKAAQREIVAGEDLRSAVFGLAQTALEPPSWSTVIPKKRIPGMPVLFTSDFQWGEVINRDELDGVNAFDRHIASARYKRLIDKTIELCDLQIAGHEDKTFPGLYYLRGGDMVSGDIHQELRETNDLSSLPAVKDLVEHEVAGLKKLADRFGRIHVISVPGNHGRQTIKPQAKKYAEANYDTLSAWMIEMYFHAAGDTRITFDIPASGDKLFDIYGYTFCLTHGDRMGSRGGEGFIGPAATIARGWKKLIQYYAQLGQHVDYCCTGHFHYPLELPYGFGNGCLPGYSEYAKDNRLEPTAPEQKLFFVHPNHGVTARWPILLEPRVRVRRSTEAL